MASAGRILMMPVGNWTSGNDYGFLDVVYYDGSSWIAKTDITNSTTDPKTDTANWQIQAKGYLADSLAETDATDTEGLLGTIGATVTGQALIDELADRVATKLLPIANVVNNNTTNVDGYALNAKQANPNEAGSLANQISSLNSSLDETNIKLGGNNCLIIADSYNPWIDTFENLYSGNIYRSVLGGAGFIGAGQGKTFGDLLTDSANIVPDSDILDTVIVQGFLNDGNQSRSDIISAGSTFITNCRAMYPNAKIHFVNAGWSKDVTTQATLVKTIEPSIMEIAGYSPIGIFYHNVQHIVHYYPYFIDSVHQNASGYAHLGIAIYNAIKGYEYSCPYNPDYSVLTANSDATNISGSFSSTMNGKNILIDPFTISFTCNAAKNTGQTLSPFSLSGGYVIGNSAGGYIQMQGTLNFNPCDIFLQGGSLVFTAPFTLVVGTTYTLRGMGITVPFFKG